MIEMGLCNSKCMMMLRVLLSHFTILVQWEREIFLTIYSSHSINELRLQFLTCFSFGANPCMLC